MTEIQAIEPASDAASMATDPARALLRHLVATLAYRAAKVLRDCPAGFASFSLGSGRREPVQIVSHLGDLMTWAVYLANGEYRWKAEGSTNWEREVKRFFDRLAELDARLARPEPLGQPAELIVQGPLADALTHVGQLSLLRGAAGSPVRPESYARAKIAIGCVTMEQPEAGREFDGDASALS